MNRRLFAVLAVILLCLSPVAAAQESSEDSEDDEDEGDTIVNIDLGEVVDAIDDLINDFDSFRENWDDKLRELIKAMIFGPFLALLKYLVTQLARVLLHTPDVYPNPAVEEIHRQALLVTYILSGLVFMIAGLLHMVGPILGVSYREVRMVLPRLLVALVFASVSLPLLQYMVDFSNVLVHAFEPNGLQTSAGEIFGTSASLVLVWVINSLALLAVLLIFIIRSAYIMFVAAISPLLALGWSLPRVKRYADSFIAGWFTALMMAPLDMIVLKFSFALMSGQGGTISQTLSNWVFGMAASVLLILVPYQLYGASQAIVGQAYSLSSGIKSRIKKEKSKRRRGNRQDYWKRQERKWDQYRQERLKKLGRPQHHDPGTGEGRE